MPQSQHKKDSNLSRVLAKEMASRCSVQFNESVQGTFLYIHGTPAPTKLGQPACLNAR